MARRPQTPSSVVPQRDANGRLLPDQGSLNPGGMPKWVGEVRKALGEGSKEAAEYLIRVVRGEEIDAGVKDRSFAAKTILEFTVPKPKEVDADKDDTPKPLSEVGREKLAEIARLDS